MFQLSPRNKFQWNAIENATVLCQKVFCNYNLQNGAHLSRPKFVTNYSPSSNRSNIKPNAQLTHWGRGKMAAIFQTTFQMHFLEWKLIDISLKFVPKGPVDNIPALVQIMAWRRPGDKSLSEPMVVCSPTHICVTRPQWVNGWFYRYLIFVPLDNKRLLLNMNMICRLNAFVVDNEIHNNNYWTWKVKIHVTKWKS